ncbi:MAG: 3-phosphoglycerate dehydrogenase [Oscillospiraceae bacterium]|jgi:D-3-phosphoglycerate dehydrogenase|nr:3-phosphoglycerate dehydrogenase [Oscillospiraceae bacterium]
MYKVKTLNNIKADSLERLDFEKYSVSAEIDDPDAIIVRSAKMHETEFNQELLCIARAGAGYNNIPIDRCAEKGIIVFNTPGANAEAVKELVLCALLLSSRDVLGGIDWVKSIAAEGENISALVEKQKAMFAGPELSGKTLGVVGLGAIGAKIARAATVLGMTVYGYDPYLSVEAAWQLSSEIIQANDLDTIYKNSDYITLHVPHLESTNNMINKASIAKMKPGIRIVNIARAELVCDDSILDALASGQVSCYVTDFPNEKTSGKAGVIAIPHLGASTPESEDKCVSMACSEIIEYIENGNLINSVNMAGAYMPRTGDPRVCVIHDNVPEMIAKITGTVSSFGLNIENSVYASTKGRLPSYMMIDVDAVPDGLEAALGSISGVTRVRVLL